MSGTRLKHIMDIRAELRPKPSPSRRLRMCTPITNPDRMLQPDPCSFPYKHSSLRVTLLMTLDMQLLGGRSRGTHTRPVGPGIYGGCDSTTVPAAVISMPIP